MKKFLVAVKTFDEEKRSRQKFKEAIENAIKWLESHGAPVIQFEKKLDDLESSLDAIGSSLDKWFYEK